MADSTHSTSAPSLEEQLRAMILNNVTMSAENAQKSPHGSTQTQPTRDAHTSSPRGSPQRKRSHQSRRSGPLPPLRAQRAGSTSHADSDQAHGQYGAGRPEKKPGHRNVPNPAAVQRGRGQPHPAPLRILQRPQPTNNTQPPSEKAQSTLNQRLPLRPPNDFGYFQRQCRYLDGISATEIPKVEMTSEEYAEKEAFRVRLETTCCQVMLEGGIVSAIDFGLMCFGSLSSGFATRGSDMDLAIISLSQTFPPAMFRTLKLGGNVPRMLEKAFLEAGLGARLLTRTRVPILKVCERPTPELHSALCAERRKWDELPEEEKYPSDISLSTTETEKLEKLAFPDSGVEMGDFSQGPHDENASRVSRSTKLASLGTDISALEGSDQRKDQTSPNHNPSKQEEAVSPNSKDERRKIIKQDRPWLREKALGPLDFPHQGIGIQCDINFSNSLALHNTLLLRCYSHCDPRVRPMVLFVKAWAKQRKINHPYSGTLSSYGYVLMVLHFLANIATPPVVPNLQLMWRPPTQGSWSATLEETTVDGYDVRFWRDEEEIKRRASDGRLMNFPNTHPLGALLRNFFYYFATRGANVSMDGFNWTQDVLSLRSETGLLSKVSKGWTGAKTTTSGTKEVRHRFLFAIEDPFEWDHNVARTVTHNGIVAIRDEFRRAHRILCAVGRSIPPEGELFDRLVETPPTPTPAKDLQQAGISRYAPSDASPATAALANP